MRLVSALPARRVSAPAVLNDSSGAGSPSLKGPRAARGTTWSSGDFDRRWPIRKGRQLMLQSRAPGCKPLQMVAGTCFRAIARSSSYFAEPYRACEERERPSPNTAGTGMLLQQTTCMSGKVASAAVGAALTGLLGFAGVSRKSQRYRTQCNGLHRRSGDWGSRQHSSHS